MGARALEVGIWGAWRNVLINLPGLSDESARAQVKAEADAIAERASQRASDVMRVLDTRA